MVPHWIYYDRIVDGKRYFDRRETCVCDADENHWADESEFKVETKTENN